MYRVNSKKLGVVLIITTKKPFHPVLLVVVHYFEKSVNQYVTRFRIILFHFHNFFAHLEDKVFPFIKQTE